MSHPRATSNDVRYGLEYIGAQYIPSSIATRPRLEPQQRPGNDVNGYNSSLDISDRYDHDRVSSSFTSPPLQPRQGAQTSAWYQTDQDQAMSGNNLENAYENAAPGSGVIIESYPSSHDSLDNVERDEGEQVPRAQASNTVDRSRHNSSESSYHMIGTIYENDMTSKLQFRCNIEGCTGATCARAQELKRHHDSFHKGLKWWCPVQGCKYSDADGNKGFKRKDKWNEHVRDFHQINLEE